MYYIDGTKYEERPRDKLGGGSEGTVYAFPPTVDECVKLFHDPDPADANAARLATYRGKKVQGILDLGLKLPDRFVLPQRPALDATGKVIGYTMSRVPSTYDKLKVLLDKTYRLDHQIGLREITRLFAALLGDMDTHIHGNGLVIGDINAGALMVDAALNYRFVDMDSYSYPNLPALATTELFCHPDLYPNIGSGQGDSFVRHTPAHDRFSMAVLFVLLAVHGAHPFRMGLHTQFSSLQDRARNGITVFDDEVSYPAFLPRREILSDDLIQTVQQVLKQQNDQALTAALLSDFADAVTDCASCGSQYHASRRACPTCQAKTTVDVAALAAFVIDHNFFSSPDTILFVQQVAKELRLVTRRNNQMIIHVVGPTGARAITTNLPAVPGARYRFFADYLAISTDPRAPAPNPATIYRIDGGALVPAAETTSGVLENQTCLLETSGRYLYRTAGNSLVCGRMFGTRMLDEPVMQVHTAQTWFTVDRTSGSDNEVLFGYDRALLEQRWFIAVGNESGEQFVQQDVPVAALRSREQLVDFAVYFAADSVLLVRSTRYRGVECVRYAVIGLDGAIRLERLVSSKDEHYPYWERIHGKLYQPSGVVHVMPDGLVKHTLSTDTCTVLSGTEGVASVSDTLFRVSGGVGVITGTRVTRVSKK